jgi:hypothetical protein
MVTDLTATALPSFGDVPLRWTNSGDNGMSGVCAQFDVRRFTEVINDANWDSATSVTAGWSPNAMNPGTFRTQVVSDPGFLPTYFAVRYRDAAGNMSPTSNPWVVNDWGW